MIIKARDLKVGMILAVDSKAISQVIHTDKSLWIIKEDGFRFMQKPDDEIEVLGDG